MLPELTAAHCQVLLASFESGALVEDSSGMTLLVNQQLCDLFQLPEASACIGRPSAELFEKIAEQFVDPAGFLGGLDAIRGRGTVVRSERFSDANSRPLTRDAVPVLVDGVIVGWTWIFRDLSSRKATEDLERQKAFYDSILEALPAQLAVFSPTGTYEYVTPSAIRDPEVREWLVGKTDVEYGIRRNLPREVAEQRRDRIAQVIEGKTVSEFEESFPTREGEMRHFRRYLTPIFTEQGDVRHVLGYGLDVTIQRHVEQQLLQSQKMDAVGRLAGGIAHDFNNLLTVINGFSEALRDELSDDDDRRELLDPILEASRRAADLTSQLLAFSRQALVEPRLIDINRAIDETATMLRRLLGESIDMRVELVPGAHTVRAGAGKLQQVLVNLAVNARDAMPDGGVLSVETRLLDITDDTTAATLNVEHGRYVELRVVDTGTGMSQETRSHLFEPFFTTKAVGRGTGLGLSTVYGIVTRAKGQILVESTLGVGSTFRVLLPRIDAAPTEDRPAAAAIPRGHETILVAEDESGVQELVLRILTGLGYTVLTADNGTEAVLRSAQHPGTIDLLLSDVVMPDFGGTALADRIRAQRPGIKVLFMSGYTGDDMTRHGVEAATKMLVQKPFTTSELAKRIRAAIDQTE